MITKSVNVLITCWAVAVGVIEGLKVVRQEWRKNETGS